MTHCVEHPVLQTHTQTHKHSVRLTHLQLHWLPITVSNDYKLCFLVHKTLLSHTPAYVADQLTAVANIPARSSLCGSVNGDVVVQYHKQVIGLVIELFKLFHGRDFQQHFNCWTATQLLDTTLRHFFVF